MSKLIENLKAARKAGVPLVAIVTQDQPATVAAIAAAVNHCPQITWDCINGFLYLNDPEGREALDGLPEPDRETSPRPTFAFKSILKFPDATMVFAYNANAWLHEPPVVQAIQNLREHLKENKRMLLLLGPSFADMPLALQADVVVLEEELPTTEQLSSLITDLHEQASKPAPKSEELARHVDAVRGLPALFTVEQVVSMSFRKAGLDLNALWERKMATINAVKGLHIERGKMRYSDLAGMEVVMDFLRRKQSGPRPARLILFWDEIEKMMAGAASGDESGGGQVATDFLNVCLKKMEGLGWAGIILFGVPGSGKTALADATAGEFDLMKVTQDFGAMKGRYVGDSESAIRTAFGVVESLGGEDVLVIATCNKMKTLPAEFRRRFWLGNWYYDVPTLIEQEPMKRIYEKKYSVTGPWPNTTNWTGAEIRNCARLAVELRCSLDEAGGYIVPIATADPDSLEMVRNVAENKFLSVNRRGADGKPTVWQRSQPAPAGATVAAAFKGKRQIGGGN